MIIKPYSYEVHAYPTAAERISSRLDRLAEKALRPILRPFVKGFLGRAKERGIISNDYLHDLDGALDERLPPRR